MTSTETLNNNGVSYTDLQSQNPDLYNAIQASRICYDQILDNPGDIDSPCIQQVKSHDTTAENECASEKWKNTYYCACVNAPVNFPECVYSPCKYENFPYMDSRMLTTIKNKAKYCPNHISCEDIVSLDGTSNIFDNYKSMINCGASNVLSPGQTVSVGAVSLLMDSPGILLVVFILFISVAILIALTFLPKITKPLLPTDKHGSSE